MIEAIEKVLQSTRPDWVLVYGDTDSTLAGTLAAVKLHIPVAHVEAGLRSFNRKMPEEINRVLTDHAADILFAPTETGRQNLLNEGIAEWKIKLVGDVMYDASLFYTMNAHRPSLPDELNIQGGDFVLCTIHRAENTDNLQRLKNIFQGLGDSGEKIILPMHPRTRAKVSGEGFEIPGNVWVIDPVGYLEMVWLEANCRCVATDSGGVQKEAYFHGKPCITLRDETEWKELVDTGVNYLTGANASLIRDYLVKFPGTCAFTESLYGSGAAASLICKELKKS
jgi:UDP-GlcNAc3NAcA epimerase